MMQQNDRDIDIFQQFESFDFASNQLFQDGWQSILKRLGNSASSETFLKAKVFFFSRQVKPLKLEKYLSWKKVASSSRQENGGALTSICAENENPTDTHEEQVKEESLESESKYTLVSDSEESQMGKVSFCSGGYTPLTSESTQCSTSETQTMSLTTPILCDNDQVAKHSESHVSVESTDNSSNASQTQNAESGPSSQIADDQPSLSLAEIAELIQNQQPIPGLVKLDVQPTNSRPTPSALVKRPKPWQRIDDDAKLSAGDTT